jgi:hypothetical protein
MSASCSWVRSFFALCTFSVFFNLMFCILLLSIHDK